MTDALCRGTNDKYHMRVYCGKNQSSNVFFYEVNIVEMMSLNIKYACSALR